MAPQLEGREIAADALDIKCGNRGMHSACRRMVERPRLGLLAEKVIIRLAGCLIRTGCARRTGAVEPELMQRLQRLRAERFECNRNFCRIRFLELLLFRTQVGSGMDWRRRKGIALRGGCHRLRSGNRARDRAINRGGACWHLGNDRQSRIRSARARKPSPR